MAVRVVQVSHLLATGVLPNVRDKDKRGGAHFAAAKGELEILQLLHSKGVDVDAEDAIGRTPAHYAALHDHDSVISFLATKSAWLDACDATDCTALHLAARGGAAAAAKRLIALGANTSLCNRWHLTAFGMTHLLDEICAWPGSGMTQGHCVHATPCYIHACAYETPGSTVNQHQLFTLSAHVKHAL